MKAKKKKTIKPIDNKFQNAKHDFSFWESIGSGWGIFISALTIFGMGFGAGDYVTNHLEKIDSFEEKAKWEHEYLDYRYAKEKEVFELHSNITNLQIELQQEKMKHGYEKK